MRLAAAISPCPNDVFIFAGLITGAVGRQGWDLDFEYHDVETLNRGTREGRWDLAKISYASYPGCARDYRLLGCGGALGRGCGPLLLSNRPQSAIDPERELLVPGRHTTANFLLDFFHPDPPAKTFVPFDELYRRLLGPAPCQGVVIHEMRFTYARDGLHLIRDLGAHWESATGHPIPLGAVALRRGVAAGAEDAEALIRASLDWARGHEAEALALCREHAQSMAEEVLRAHIGLYVNAFSRELGEEGERAVEYFLARLDSLEAAATPPAGTQPP